MHSQKIHSIESLVAHVAQLRNQGKRIVQCDGVFDVIHIGHIRHLEAARSAGDYLFVTVTQDEFVNRGPHRPVFSLELRMEALASLQFVDAVVANPWPSAAEAITELKPDIFSRGPTYESAEAVIEQTAIEERAAMQRAGAEYLVTTDLSYRSTEVIGQRFSAISSETREYLHAFKSRHSSDSVLQWLEKVSGLRVLVVGEAIIDDYHYVEAIGKSSKEPVLVTRNLSSQQFAGGILAVANNVAEFVASVELVSVLGSNDSRADFVRAHLKENVAATFLEWPDAPTILKQRYIESYSFTKLFEVYDMPDGILPIGQVSQLDAVLASRLRDVDLAIVVDFGHGMIGRSTTEILCEQSRYLAINVQANAGNHGYHTLGKFPRADFITAAENELRLETRDRHGSLRSLIHDVATSLCAPKAVVTRGKFGCLCFGADDGIIEIPAVAGEVVDRVGAGDAFLSVSALLAALGAPIEVVGFVGNAASAQAIATVGHQRSLDRQVLIDHIRSLLR